MVPKEIKYLQQLFTLELSNNNITVIPKEIKYLCKLQNLETMQPSDSEYYKLLQWIDNILDIPFNIYKQP